MSASRRGATDLSGVLIVDKPAGVTSHDVVSTIRRITGERRVGHAGTLDPAATGVLVVLVGPATRLTPYLAAAEKSYLARIVFGTRTDTDDAEGEVVEELAVPGSVLDERIAAASLAASLGTSSQTPPAFSAIKQGGRVAHREARAGAPMEMVPRTIHVHAASLEDIDPGPPASWDVALTVSKGTYVRAIARDLGSSLGTVAHLGALRRTASGAASLDAAHTLEELAAAADIRSHFADPLTLLGMPTIHADAAMAARVAVGATISPDAAVCGADESPTHYAVVSERSLLGIYHAEGEDGALRAEVVLSTGVSR